MNQDRAHEATPIPICPRCGYDLSGIQSSWVDSCPVRGVCAECGLEFPWADIVHPMRAVPAWSYEHSPVARGRALSSTLRRALRPWKFWSDLRLPFVIRPRRLADVALLCLLVSHLVIGNFTMWTSPWVGAHRGFISQALGTGIPNWAHSLVSVLFPYQAIGYHDAMSPGDSPWVVLSMLCFLLTPIAFLALPITMRICRVRKLHLLRIGVYSLTPMPIIFFVFFLFCRGSPLRPRPASWWWEPSTYAYVFEAFAGLPLLILAWLALFWWFATSRYLKLPHAAGVTAAMVLLGLLASTVAVAFLHPGFTHNHVLYAIFW